MSWPTDTLTGVFLFLFAFGLIFSVASLLLGTLGGHFHLPGASSAGHGSHLGPHGHGGHFGGLLHGHGHGHAHGGAVGHAGATVAVEGPQGLPAAPGPLNLSTLMVFVTWFGAAGTLLRSYGAIAATSLIVATIAGILGAALAWAFLAKLLWRGQTQLDPYNYRIEGALARVVAPIRPGGTGEIIYTLDGKRRVDGARSDAGATIAAGTDVAILRFAGGLAHVTPLIAPHDDEFLALEPEPTVTGASGRAAAREGGHELAE